jgi:hypothetical protein
VDVSRSASEKIFVLYFFVCGFFFLCIISSAECCGPSVPFEERNCLQIDQGDWQEL